jgi:hypothetical protein
MDVNLSRIKRDGKRWTQTGDPIEPPRRQERQENPDGINHRRAQTKTDGEPMAPRNIKEQRAKSKSQRSRSDDALQFDPVIWSFDIDLAFEF